MQPTSRQVGLELIGLNNTLRRMAGEPQSACGERMTSMQIMILGYLDDHRDDDVFQKDLEKIFRIRRSTATGILKVMEREGYLTRRPVPQDARLKKLMLTAHGQSFCNEAKRRSDEIEAVMLRGMTEDEVGTLFSLLGRLRDNLESGERPLTAAERGMEPT